ncbi:hypothetical protein RB595_002406 [Gaeumannomyces hyphopodioides]
MSSQVFEIKEHIIDASHIREYPRATAHSQEEVLKVAVKQYIPKSNPNPQPGDVTVIGAHANGFPKELYEAMWEDLVSASAARGFRIRAIWIADIAWQGVSGALNEGRLGSDPSWSDASRDMLHMVNVFRAEMPRPLVGVGHSFGGAIVANLAFMHPRLFETLVLMDPVVMHFRSIDPRVGGGGPQVASAARRDLWPSRADAEASFRRSAFYRAWDPRVLDAWCRHGLRDCPTALHPDAPAGSVTLATTKHQEVFTYLRTRAQRLDPATGRLVFDRALLRDIHPEQLDEIPDYDFYQPDSARVFERLPHVAPGVLWIFGGTSNLGTPAMRADKLAVTGTGVGGSGGVAAGRVAEHVLEGVGHLVAMEKPTVCAEQAAAWIGLEIERWRKEEEELQIWWRKPGREKWAMDDQLKAMIGGPRKSKL